MNSTEVEQDFAFAETCRHAGRLDLAIKEYVRILSVRPTHAQSKLQIAVAAHRLGLLDLLPADWPSPRGISENISPLIAIDDEARVARFALEDSTCDRRAMIAAFQVLASTATAQRPVAPDITIAVPVFNTPAPYLHCCMASIFRQTIRPRQVILVDDHSSSADTIQYLGALENGPDLRVLRNTANLSLGPTMNVALRATTTRYVLKLDSDDIARPTLVERCDQFIRNHPPVDVLGCQMKFFGLNTTETRHSAVVTKREAVWSSWFVNHSGVLLNRESVLAVGGYRSRRRLAEDHDLWVRMMLHGHNRFVNLQETLVDYRCSSSGLTANFSSFVRFQMLFLKLLTRLAPEF
jgi:Glycosyl transferase family 2